MQAKAIVMRIPFIVIPSILLMAGLSAYPQKKAHRFNIIRNGNTVGTMRFTQTTSGTTDSLELESNVKTKLISTFNAHARESAIFNNGILSKSSIFRELNGNEKANKKHEVQNNQYIISKGKNSKVVKGYPINYNMLCLYSREPGNIGRVYSDNFETFITIQKVDDHKYKITLPDGHYNYYTYKEGVLHLVEVHHTLYSAIITLVNE